METTDEFWAGDFGDQYTERNVGRVNQNARFFHSVFGDLSSVARVLEFGCGSGENLQALEEIGAWGSNLFGIEVNEKAAAIALDKGFNVVVDDMIRIGLQADLPKFDLVVSKGVAIHVPPDRLKDYYTALWNRTRRGGLILLAEYYSPTPVEVSYRGHDGKLWRRDFAGDMMTLFPDLTIDDYGFAYHADPWGAAQDDLTWFLLRKAA